MRPVFNPNLLLAFTAGLSLAALPLRAQIVPDLTPVIQNTVDRQVERAQNEAAERAQQQVEAVQNRTTERVSTQQVDSVQNQVVEHLGGQVERAQAQAAERAQAEVERVQLQVERAQSRVEQLQSQTTERAQQATTDAVGAAVGRGIERAGDVGDARPDTRGVAAATDDAAVPVLPAQMEIPRIDGDVAFVEITLEPGVRTVAYEWVMLVTPEQRQQLDDEAGDLMAFLSDSEAFTAADSELLTFTVPPDLDANDAILQLVPADLRELMDRNHVYTEQADAVSADADELLPLLMPMACDAPLTVGIIDSAVDTQHPAFAKLHAPGKRLQQRSFVENTLIQPATHGTAVASVLLGSNASASLQPLLPHATLFIAAVFHANEGNYQGATAARVLRALDWLTSEADVQVINMSLAGPPNRLLERAIATAQRRGKLIIAAAGNEGAYGPVRYPAAYEGVVGVTAVARDRSVFRWANQGPQVDFAALGVDVIAAADGGTFGPASGTSIAAPVVAALVACALKEQGIEVAIAEQTLAATAIDLGEPGIDAVYGKGLLHP